MSSIAMDALNEFVMRRNDKIVFTFMAKPTEDSRDYDLYGVGISNRLYCVSKNGIIQICNMNYLHQFTTHGNGFSVHVANAQPANENHSFSIYPSDGALSILKKIQQLQKQNFINPYQPTQSANTVDDFSKLQQLKKMLDSGLITQSDYENAKKRILGI